eukprot:TRINITY_DN5947_c0_g1_i1.p1 TRINITY_DN5947_c0_g1~~TRINITY_DN5947_c0_g1_i1.p1  ORF type:complete len:339 (+),score=30.35 TRINITY_DN5947_c0_g1_i1:24-1019(+)
MFRKVSRRLCLTHIKAPLFERCVTKGATDQVEKLLMERCDPNQKRFDSLGRETDTLFSIAIQKNFLKMAEIMLDHGARADASSVLWQDGVLLSLIRRGETKMVERLIEAGAIKSNVMTKRRVSIVAACSLPPANENTRKNILKCSLADRKRFLYWALRGKMYDEVDMIMDIGVQGFDWSTPVPNTEQIDASYPLLEFALIRKPEHVSAMLKAGATVAPFNPYTKNKSLPEIARQHQEFETMVELIRAGGDAPLRGHILSFGLSPADTAYVEEKRKQLHRRLFEENIPEELWLGPNSTYRRSKPTAPASTKSDKITDLELLTRIVAKYRSLQ